MSQSADDKENVWDKSQINENDVFYVGAIKFHTQFQRKRINEESKALINAIRVIIILFICRCVYFYFNPISINKPIEFYVAVII